MTIENRAFPLKWIGQQYRRAGRDLPDDGKRRLAPHKRSEWDTTLYPHFGFFCTLAGGRRDGGCIGGRVRLSANHFPGSSRSFMLRKNASSW